MTNMYIQTALFIVFFTSMTNTVISVKPALSQATTFSNTKTASWATDHESGCKVWNEHPIPNESVSWSGTCEAGVANGPGVVNWTVDGKLDQVVNSDFNNGRENGLTHIKFKNGTQYTVAVVDGFIINGNIKDINGNECAGPFVNNKMEGQVNCKYADGATYSGEVHAGLTAGKGTMKWTDGEECTGTFVNARLEGHGVCKLSDGSSYDGSFANGQKNGHGVSKLSDGSSYDGNFVNGRKNGRGVFKFANGNSYVGAFKDGKANGQGTFNFVSGQVRVGNFVDGKYVP